MGAHFGGLALANFSAAHKPSADGTIGALVELGIDELLVDVLRFAPCGAIVVAVPSSPTLVMGACATEEARCARAGRDDHAGALAVAHDAGVAIARLLMALGLVAIAPHHFEHHDVVPCGTIVVAAADVEVDAAAANVHTAVAVVGHGHYRSVVCRSDGGYAVRNGLGGWCGEDLHLRLSGNGGLADGYEEMGEVHSGVGS